MLLGVWSLTVTGSGRARAEERVGHESIAPPKGSVRAGLALAVGLDDRSPGAPVALIPDATVGITDRFFLGLVHGGRALGLLDSDWGFCLTGRRGGCGAVYSGTGIDAGYAFLRVRGLELVARSRFFVARFTDPLKLRTTVGLTGLYRIGPVALTFDPHVSVGLVNRGRGNGDAINVPIHCFVGIGRRVAVYLRTGLQGLLHSFADQYRVPLGFGVLVRPAAGWMVGAQFVFRKLLGPLNTYLERDLLLFAEYRFDALF